MDSVGLVMAVLQKRSIIATGYDPANAQIQPWTHPAAPFISAPESPMDAIVSLTAERRRTRWAIALGVLLTALAFFAAGMFFATMKLPKLGQGAGAMSWAVVDVDARGVVLATRAGRLLVPVGGQLPNGDLVVQVLPARRSVLLSSGTLTVHRPGVDAAAQAERKN